MLRTTTGLGAPIMAIAKSADGFTVVVTAIAVLLVKLGSKTEVLTVAKLVIVPMTLGVATMVTLAVALLARLPSVTVTVLPDRKALPCEGVAETKVTLPGKVSTNVTPVAVDGPLLVILRV